jgi:uncharacterized protein YndB with AHSA1/START domain
MSAENPSSSGRELVINRIIDLPPEKLYRGWTDPELMPKWFAPKPWTTSAVSVEVRPGGANMITMRSPEGQDFPNAGVYLEVVPNEKLVFTDAYTSAWQPSAHPFMTVILTFEDLGGGKTNYTARVLHWTAEDREKHEAMGFYPGWNQCLDQLIALMSAEP